MFKKTSKDQRENLRARRAEQRRRLRTQATQDCLLACYLYVGGSDGNLTTEEVLHIEHALKINRVHSIPSFDSLSRKIGKLLSSSGSSLLERRHMMARLRDFALCDGDLSKEEEEALRAVEHLFRLSPEARRATHRAWGTGARPATERAKTRDRVNSRANTSSTRWKRSQSSAPEQKEPRPHWSYEYLGCSEHDTDETIKKCYRRLAVTLHPDKHAARGSTPEETLKHIRAFQKLQEAYETILKIRKARPLATHGSSRSRP